MQNGDQNKLGVLVGLAALALVVFAAPDAVPNKEWSTVPLPPVIQQYMDAFNAHDPDAVGRTLAEDVSWLSLSGDAISVDGKNRDAVVTWLTSYFKSFPDVTSRVIARPAAEEGAQTSRFFVVRECPTWTGKDGKVRSQAAWAVFELNAAGLIRRVWYHEAEKVVK